MADGTLKKIEKAERHWLRWGRKGVDMRHPAPNIKALKERVTITFILGVIAASMGNPSLIMRLYHALLWLSQQP